MITKNISCDSYFNIAAELSFYSGIPSGKTIEGVFEDALEGGTIIRKLTTSNTKAMTFKFHGK